MQLAPIPFDDGERLAELTGLGVTGAPADEQLDRIAAAAVQCFGVPICLINVVDRDKVVIKSGAGLDVSHMRREVSFCGHTILGEGSFVVADTRTDERFADNPLVTGPPHVGFYAGYPIAGPSGHRIGTFCIIDHQPRSPGDADLMMLRVLAEAAQNRIAEISRTRRLDSAELLAAATNAAGIGLWKWDVPADVLTWDDKMYAIYGIRAADFSGAYEAWAAGLHPDDAEEARLETQRALDGVKAYDTQFRVVWPGGGIHWIQAKATVTRDEMGNPVSMMGLNWDITAEKEIEAKVGAAAARDAQAALMETVEVAISELPIVLYSTGWVAGDGSERWLLGNAGSLLGVSKTDFEQGDDLLANVVSTDRGKIELEMAEARSKGRGSISQQFRVLGRDGTERWCQHVAKLNHANHTQSGALLDIDTAKRLSEKLNESEKMEALGRLAGAIAHDFNNVLGVISNSATLARDAAGAAGIQVDIDRILAAAKRAGSTTRQLLTISRPPTGSQSTDINQCVVGMQEFLSTAVGAAVELNVQTSDEKVIARIDPTELDRVIMNLAVNARDAMPGGGKLGLVVSRGNGRPERPGPTARLTVSDTGTGMSPDTVRRIFEPFFTTKDAGRGVGLGLATCSAIVTAAGGSIDCTSAEGAGTTFTVDLPLLELGDTDDDEEGGGNAIVRFVEQPDRSAGQQQKRFAVGGRSILIVEDDADLRATTQRLLEREGFVVAAVGTIAAARGALPTLDADLVISDIQLPDGDGMDFLRELKAAHPDLPVVISTGVPTLEAASRAVNDGACEFLIKPVAAADLISVARAAVVKGRRLKLQSKYLAGKTEGREFLVDLSATEEAFNSALSTVRMHFQPIVNSCDSSVFGYEALLRCDQPRFANPLRLVEAAEMLGRVEDLGLSVRSAIAEALPARSSPAHAIFVNLHPSEVRADLLGIATEPLLPFAENIVLEITERAALDSDRRLEDDLNRLRDCGYRIAIDDLGEGYSGLATLVRVHPEFAKIDKSLITDIDRTPLKQDIVSAIIGMLQEHDIRVVAEGVETPAQRAILRELECDLLQGFLFAKPGPPFVNPRTVFVD